MILASLIIGILLLVWFRTDAWVEYCRLFHLNCLSDYKGFDREYKQDVSLTYHIFLRRFHNNFFVRMITCPICITIWFTLLYGICFSVGAFFILTGMGQFIMGMTCALAILSTLPYVIVGSLLTYTIIDRLLG